MHWKITEQLALIKIQIKSGRWELLTEGTPGIRFIPTAWKFDSLLIFTSKHGYKYLTCKSTIMMIMNFAMVLICSVDVAAQCQSEEKPLGPTWDFAWRRCSSSNVWEQVVDIGHRLRLHRALLLRCGLRPHITKHNSQEERRGVRVGGGGWVTDANAETEK